MKLKQKRLVLLTVDGAREDWFEAPFEQKDFGWNGYEATAFNDRMKRDPGGSRFYAMRTNSPSITIQ